MICKLFCFSSLCLSFTNDPYAWCAHTNYHMVSLASNMYICIRYEPFTLNEFVDWRATDGFNRSFYIDDIMLFNDDRTCSTISRMNPLIVFTESTVDEQWTCPLMTSLSIDIVSRYDETTQVTHKFEFKLDKHVECIESCCSPVDHVYNRH
jgi:hypothetical protein